MIQEIFTNVINYSDFFIFFLKIVRRIVRLSVNDKDVQIPIKNGHLNFKKKLDPLNLFYTVTVKYHIKLIKIAIIYCFGLKI